MGRVLLEEKYVVETDDQRHDAPVHPTAEWTELLL